MSTARVDRASSISSSQDALDSSFVQQRRPFSGTCCDVRRKMDSPRQSTTFRSMVGSHEASKHFTELVFHQRKVTETVLLSAARLIHHSFLVPDEASKRGSTVRNSTNCTIHLFAQLYLSGIDQQKRCDPTPRFTDDNIELGYDTLDYTS